MLLNEHSTICVIPEYIFSCTFIYLFRSIYLFICLFVCLFVCLVLYIASHFIAEEMFSFESLLYGDFYDFYSDCTKLYQLKFGSTGSGCYGQ